MNFFTRKIICTVIFVSVFTGAYVPNPAQAPTEVEAQQLVEDVWVGVQSAWTAIRTTVSSIADVEISGYTRTLLGKEFSLDAIAWNVAKAALRQITSNIVDWINSGFAGSPAFIENYNQFLLDSADVVFNEFIDDTYLDIICSPFRVDIRTALNFQYNQVDRTDEPLRCTISDIENVKNFLDGSFADGGWQSWIEITNDPQNTPYGAYLNAQGSLSAKIQTADGLSRLEAEANEGFLSFSLCESRDTSSGAPQISQTGRPQPNSDCWITKPGQFIEEQLNEVISYGGQSLIEADEINEIIGALFGQLASIAITSLSGLGKASETNYRGNAGTFLEQQEAQLVFINASTSINLLAQEIKSQEDYIAIFNQTNPPASVQIDDAQEDINELRELYPGCFDVSVTNYPQILRAETLANEAETDVVTIINSLKLIESELRSPSLTAQEQQLLLEDLETIRLDPRYKDANDQGEAYSVMGTFGSSMIGLRRAIEERRIQCRDE